MGCLQGLCDSVCYDHDQNVPCFNAQWNLRKMNQSGGNSPEVAKSLLMMPLSACCCVSAATSSCFWLQVFSCQENFIVCRVLHNEVAITSVLLDGREKGQSAFSKIQESLCFKLWEDAASGLPLWTVEIYFFTRSCMLTGFIETTLLESGMVWGTKFIVCGITVVSWLHLTLVLNVTVSVADRTNTWGEAFFLSCTATFT